MKARYNAHQIFERASMRRSEAFIDVALGTGTMTSIVLFALLAGICFLIDGTSFYNIGMVAPSAAIWFVGMVYGRPCVRTPLNTYERGIGEFEAKQLWEETLGHRSLSDFLPIANTMLMAYLVSVVCFGINWVMNGGSLMSGEAYVRGECFSAFVLSMGYLLLHTAVRCVLALNVIDAWKRKEALKLRLISEY